MGSLLAVNFVLNARTAKEFDSALRKTLIFGNRLQLSFFIEISVTWKIVGERRKVVAFPVVTCCRVELQG